MSQSQTRGFLFVVPTLVALAVGIFMGRSVDQPAMRQDVGATREGRYLISAWAHPGGIGAYILDTKTGDFHSYLGFDKWLTKIGNVGEMATSVKAVKSATPAKAP